LNNYLHTFIASLFTPAELAALPPVTTADIRQDFQAVQAVAAEVPPNPIEPAEPPRPWLADLPADERRAILESEFEETQLMALSRGNPVLPENECEQRLLLSGPLEGDISGPEGKPDCHVDFFDFAALATNWLDCNDPSDPGCI